MTDDYEPRQVREEAAVNNSICGTKQSGLITFSYRKITLFFVRRGMHGQGTQFSKFPSSPRGVALPITGALILQRVYPIACKNLHRVNHQTLNQITQYQRNFAFPARTGPGKIIMPSGAMCLNKATESIT